MDVLLECNHVEKKTLIKNTLLKAQRGQSLKSLGTWAKRWGWSIQNVRTFFKLLEKDEMINTQGVGVTTLLTVYNYDTYQ